MLWFSAPPLNVARPPAPRYSITYLHFLASKRKKKDERDENAMEVDAEEGLEAKRTKVVPSVTESLVELATEIARSS